MRIFRREHEQPAGSGLTPDEQADFKAAVHEAIFPKDPYESGFSPGTEILPGGGSGGPVILPKIDWKEFRKVAKRYFPSAEEARETRRNK